MSIYRLFCVVILNCLVLKAALATNSVVISRVSFSSGDIESVANQLRVILSAQVSTNYVVSLNCDLPKIVIPNSVTNIVDSTLYNNTLSSFRNEITAKYEGDITEPTFRYVTLRCALDFIDEAFRCKSEIIGNEITIRLFPSRLQFELYSSKAAKRTGLVTFVVASPFERVKITSVEKGYLVLAPPERHHEFHRLVRRLGYEENSEQATKNGTE